VIRGVALVARQTRVLPFERVSGLLVVKRVGIPLDDGEVLSVVIGVALHAALAGSLFQTIGSVQTLMGIEARRDLRVAFQASEGGLTGRKLVTRGAVRRAVQRLVSARQRSRRNLGGCRTGQQNHDQRGLDQETKVSDAKRANARRGETASQ